MLAGGYKSIGHPTKSNRLTKEKAPDSDDKAERLSDKRGPTAFDTVERNLDTAKLKEIENTNPDKHSGSAGGDQDHSLEIVGFGATVSRKNQLTEKQLANKPAQDQIIERESPTLKASIEESTITPQGLLERIAALPLDKQGQLICTGIGAYWYEIEHQQYEILVAGATGIGKGVGGLLEGAIGLGKCGCELVQFSRELVENKPIAQEKAASAGEAFGKLLVGGIRVIEVCDQYLGGLGAAAYDGDKTKALRDISWLGHEIDRRWQAMTPAQQTELTTQLGTETLGGMMLGAGLHRLSKSASLVEKLQELGTEASQMGGSAREKYAKFIGGMAEEILLKSNGEPITEFARHEIQLTGKPFGDWPYLNEKPAPEMIRQVTSVSCVSACGEFLSNGRIRQAELIERLGAPTLLEELAGELGPHWKGHFTQEASLEQLLKLSYWSAGLRNKFTGKIELAHSVIVEGVSKEGHIIVLDPWEATRYEMTKEDFVHHWNGCAVYRPGKK